MADLRGTGCAGFAGIGETRKTYSHSMMVQQASFSSFSRQAKINRVT
jgi:hypothetical protein